MSIKKGVLLLSLTFFILSYFVFNWPYTKEETPSVIENTSISDLVKDKTQKQQSLSVHKSTNTSFKKKQCR